MSQIYNLALPKNRKKWVVDADVAGAFDNINHDVLVVFCESQEDAARVRDKLLPPWLAERGLSLAEGKTRLVHLMEGFDFLGFTVKHYHQPRTTRTGFKLLITPSKKAVVRKRQE